MASYHLAVKTISRSAGRSATAAAAYRAGARIECQREGVTHDYTRRSGVEHSQIVLPTDAPEWASDRTALWNAAEAAETRKNSTVAREFEVALPAELSADQRRDLVLDFVREISDRHKVAVDFAIHAPGPEGDHRNHHAHILLTTRQLGPEGLGAKTRELDVKTSGEVDHWRERWATMQNHALERAGSEARVDHRSHAARGLEEPPLPQLTPAQYQLERSVKRAAERDGQPYEPVTPAGKERQAVEEIRFLKPFIEKGMQALAAARQNVAGLALSLNARLEAIAKERQRKKAIEEALKKDLEKRREHERRGPDRGRGR